METHVGNRGLNSAGLMFGGAMVVVGVLLLLGQVLRISVGPTIWPFFIIMPGALLFLLSLTLSKQAGEPLAIVGSIISTVGGILLYQSATGHWTSWAYAWSLVAPTSIGAGLMLFGLLKGMPEKVRAGGSVALVGLAIFAVAATFFEFVLGISGFGLGRYGIPVLLIGIGTLWLLGTILSMARKK